MMDYPIVIVPLSAEEGGGYAGMAIDLPGCMGDGDTPEAALKDTQSAVLEWIDTYKELGRAVPAPGSAAKQARADREALLVAYRDAQTAFDGLEPRIERLEHVMAELEERAEHEEAFGRFYVITGLPAPILTIDHKRRLI